MQATETEASFVNKNVKSKCPELAEGPVNMWYVYIIICEDNSLYTGYTDNPKRRLTEHKNGKGGHYTSTHKPLRMIYLESLSSKSEALKREKKINILKLKI